MSGDLSHHCSPRLLSRPRRGWGRRGVGWDRRRALSRATGTRFFIWDIKLIFAVNTQALFLGCCSQLQQLHWSRQRPTAGAQAASWCWPRGDRTHEEPQGTQSCWGRGWGCCLSPSLPAPTGRGGSHGWRNTFAPSLGSLHCYRTYQSCCCPSRSPHETFAESNINTEVPLETCFIKFTLLPANLQLILC